MQKLTTLLSPTIVAIAVASSNANAATVVEYFNNYGSNAASLASQGSAGGGWSGGWGGSNAPGYQNGQGLTYSATGYANTGNESGSNDGGSLWGGTGGGGDVASRALATGLTGTVWISALTKQNRGSDTTAESKLWIDQGDVDTSYVGLVNREAAINTGSGDTFGTSTFANNTTHLFLLRLVLDGSGSDDSLDFWINPDLSTGVGGLGTADNSISGSDFFGTSLDGIGVSFRRQNSMIDAIRISNEANGFDLVTNPVPEPSSVALWLTGALLLIRRRR